MRAADRWSWLLRPASGGVDAFTSQHLDAALDLVVTAVPGSFACSITELAGGTYRTSVASCQVALDLDIAQYRSGDGPCMTAARDRQTQQVRDTAAAARFRVFANLAVELSVQSSLSIPIRTTYHPAALNLYSRDVDGFDERSHAIADFLGRALTARLLGSSGTRALSISETVRVTKRRALMRAALDVSPGADESPSAAFAGLARRSSREGRSIFDVASELIDHDGQPR